jgi:hypothetical protein
MQSPLQPLHVEGFTLFGGVQSSWGIQTAEKKKTYELGR